MSFAEMSGARAAMELARGSAHNLSKLAEQILDKVPEAGDWEPVRKFLKVRDKSYWNKNLCICDLLILSFQTKLLLIN